MASDPSLIAAIEPLPSSPFIQRKICALQILQLQTMEVDAEFHQSVWELECRFQEKHQTIYEKRRAIVNGEYEPDDNECIVPDSIICDEIVKENDVGENEPDGNYQSVPDFWLNVLKNSGPYVTLVHYNDIPALKHLTNIQVKSFTPPDMSFVLEFSFSTNPYFENSVLTKKYSLCCSVDPDNPFDFDGAEIYKSIGCEILWRDGHTKQDDSFFNFFTPPAIPDFVSETEVIELRATLQMDFEIGLFIKERIIPRAISYYLREEPVDFDYEYLSSSNSVEDNEDQEEVIGDTNEL